MQANQSQLHNPLMGIIFMLLATLFFTGSDAIGKLLTENYPIMQVAFIRSVLGILIIGIYAVVKNETAKLKTSKPGWHLSRSFLGAFMLIGIFFGLKHIPLAEVIAIAFANPFIVAVLSPFVLNEKVSRHSWLAVCIGFAGVLIIARPTPDHFHIAHVTMLGFAATTALLIVTARKLALSESTLSLNLYLYPVAIIISSYWAITGWVSPSLMDWLLFFGLALFATAALGCLIQAMHYARPAVVAPIDYVRLIWTPLVGYLFWKEVPESLTWLGIVLIVISGIYIVTHGRSVPEVGVKQEPVENT